MCPSVWFTESEACGKDIKGILLSPKTAAERFERDFAAFLTSTKNSDPAHMLKHPYLEERQKSVDVAYRTEIPHNLLLGPWTDDMVQFLYWLVKSGATLSWDKSTSGEVSHIYVRSQLY